jgi:hypothetical protein
LESGSDFEDNDNFYQNSVNFLPNSYNSTNWVYANLIKNLSKSNSSNFTNLLDLNSSFKNDNIGFENKYEKTSKSNFGFEVDVYGDERSLQSLNQESEDILKTANPVDFFYSKRYNTSLFEKNTNNYLFSPNINKKSDSVIIESSDIFNGFSNLSTSKNSHDLNYQQSENQKTFYNYLIYSKNINRKFPLKKKIKKIIFKNKLPRAISTFNRDLFLDKDSNYSSLKNLESLSLDYQNTNTILDYNLFDNIRFSLKKKKLPNRFLRSRLESNSSFGKFIFDLSNINKFKNFPQNFESTFTGNSTKGLFLNKVNRYSKTGEYDLDITYNNNYSYLFKNLIKPGLIDSVSPIKKTIYLSKSVRVSPPMGSDRYKLNDEKIYLKNDFGDFSDILGNKLFDFALTDSVKSFGKKI